MIFYFSGTGNSQAIAKTISHVQAEKLISIVQEMKKSSEELTYELSKEENIVFVFPIYAWRAPQMVIEFMEKVNFRNYENQAITMIATCGENIGETTAVIKKLLQKKKMKLSSAYSVKMPNNYLVYGTVDSQAEIKRKLELAQVEMKRINLNLSQGIRDVYDIDKGCLSPLLTYGIGNLFNKFARKTTHFYANDQCISCKVCEKICPIEAIKVEEKPTWKKECTQCLACLHYCPKSAIQFGKKMSAKARYTHPLIEWYQLNQE